MNDGGGCRQQLVIRQEIYFSDDGNIALNIQVFTLIFRQEYCALICRIRPRAVYRLADTECRLQGWMRLVAAGTGPRGPPGRSLAGRRAGVRIGRPDAAARAVIRRVRGGKRASSGRRSAEPCRLGPGPWRILGVSASGCVQGTEPGCPGVRDG